MNDLSRTEWEQLIDEWIVGYANCGRDRQIMKMRYLDGVNVDRIAEAFDIDTRTVVRVCKKACSRLFAKLDKN